MRGPCGFLQVPWDRVYPPVCPLCPSSTPAAPFQAFCRQNPLAGYRPLTSPPSCLGCGFAPGPFSTLDSVEQGCWQTGVSQACMCPGHQDAAKLLRHSDLHQGQDSLGYRVTWDSAITPFVSSATLKGPPPQISKSRPGWGLPSRARALRVQRQDPTAQSSPAGKPINSPSPSPKPSSPDLHLLQTWSTTAPWGPRRARLPPR